MAESLLSSVRPTTRKGRQKERAEHFLAGTSRSAHHLDTILEESFSTSDLSYSQHSEEGSEQSQARDTAAQDKRSDCKKGCPAILKELAKSYQSVGIHTGKTAQYRKSSYPDPKKGNPPRNTSGKFLI